MVFILLFLFYTNDANGKKNWWEAIEEKKRRTEQRQTNRKEKKVMETIFGWTIVFAKSTKPTKDSAHKN